VKVVHVSYKDDQEGAAIAVDRISQALIRAGIDSQILAQKKVSDKSYSCSIANSKLQKAFSFLRVGLDLLINGLLVNAKSPYFTLPFIGCDVSKHQMLREADVIHLHWVNRGFLTLGSIEKIVALGKPVVWTLHDSWAFTGGCHMTGQCLKYQASCVGCPLTIGPDFTKHFQTKKKKLANNSNISFAAPSMWMSQKASSSDVLGNKTVAVLPNCVDTLIYKPLDRMSARSLFNLPHDESIVLFNITNDMRKGISYVRQVIAKLTECDKKILFVGFGASNIKNTIFADLPITSVGRINDNYSMAMLYNACDVLIAPALEEPFGQTYIEAMACGTPCVSFDYSGPKDIIEHRMDGYLAENLSVDSLVDGVSYCLSNKEVLGAAAIAKIQSAFSFESVSRVHAKHYKSLMAE